MTIGRNRKRVMGLMVKELVDIFGALIGVVVLSPVLALVSLAVLLTMGQPVFFTQIRAGYKGRPFRIVKFRTMRSVQPGEVWFLSDSQRVTKLGAFLRKSSIDELPELWNVIRREMSLVGPRPLLLEYLDQYTAEQRRRHDVKPGITGWAQVNGRQEISFSRRIELDVWYVDNWSLALDFCIIMKTFVKVFQKDGVRTGQAIEDVDDMGLLIGKTPDSGYSADERGKGI